MKKLLLPIVLFFPIFLFSQIAPYPDMSYDAFLCEQELYKDQIICLNDRIDEENSLSNFRENAFKHCQFADILPSYASFGLSASADIFTNCDGVCCGNGDFGIGVTGGRYDHLYNRTAYYTIDLVCQNNANGVAISKVNSNCWNVKYLETGSFLFSLEITVRHGREIEGNVGSGCNDTTYFYNCGQDRTWKQFVVNVGSQYECDDYVDEPCNLLQNGNFENKTLCPMDDPNMIYNQLKYNNFIFLQDWELLSSTKAPFFGSTCGDFFSMWTTYSTNAKYMNYPPQPLPSGDNYLFFDQFNPITGQFVNLCASQKYKFGIWGVKARGNLPSYPFNISGTNTSDFSTNPPVTLLSTININPSLFTWNQYSSEFISPSNFNGITINGSYAMVDNLTLIPVDTISFSTQLITNACDSAQLLVNIPGCYGPYDVSIEVNGETKLFSQIEDGDVIKLPLPATAVFKVNSITNSMGCQTQLNVFESLSVPGNAMFSSTDFCLGNANTITFLGDYGVFSLVNNTTNAIINSSTGIISNASGNTTYIIKHQYCTSVYFDTIFVYHNDASFTSSDICDGGVNSVNISGSLGTFSLMPPSFGATINPASGQVINSQVGNNYTIRHIVGSTCADTVFQTITVHPSNDASFTSSDICEGNTNTVNVTGGLGIFSLVPPSFGATINPVSGQIINSQVGNNYTIRYIVGSTCVDTAFQTITVISGNDASFTSSNICEGNINTVNITGGLGTFSLVPPSFGATINATSGQIINSQVGNNYTIRHIVGSTCEDTVFQTITVLENDNPSFSSSDFCLNSSNVVSISGSQGGVFSFSPSPADGATINPFNGIISNHTVGQTYSIKYITNGTCKDSSIQTISVLSLPTASVYGTSGDLCINDSLPIHISLTGSAPWSLDLSNGFQVESFSNISSSPLTVYVDNIGQYSVVSVSDIQCSNRGDSISSVIITGDSVFIKSSITDGCVPTEITFSTNLSGPDFDCIWRFGDGTILSQCDMVTHTYTQSGLYSIQFAVSSPRCQVDTTLMNFIEIYEDPVSLFNFSPQNPTIINNGIQITNLSVENLSNQWMLNNTLVSNDIEPLIELPTVIQNNDLCLIVENIHGCIDTSCTVIYVSDASLLYLPNAFIPDNDGLNDIFIPVVSNLRFFEMQIFNRWGEMIFETTDLSNGWDGTYKGVNVTPGVYTYRLVYRFWDNQENEIVNGHVTLIR